MTSPVSVAQVAPTGVASLIFTTALTVDFLTLVNSTSTTVPVTPTAVATSALAATSAPATSALATSALATSPVRVSSSAVSSSAVSSSAVSSSAVSSSAVSSSAVSSSATSALATSAPATSALATSAPATSARVTSAAATSAAATSAAATSAAATSAAATSALATSAARVSSSAGSSSVVGSSSVGSSSAIATSALRASSSVVATSTITPNTGNGQGGTPGTAGTAIPATSSGRVVGDPMFVGFLRQRYQVHGMDGVVYNILSQASVSINALFVFLESGSCPVVEGVVATNCWSHPGSYFGSLALQTSAGDQLEVVAGGATQGFSAVRFDGEAVRTVKGVEGKGAKLSFTMHNTHSMSITIDNYRLVIENSDLFVNLVSIEVLDWQQMASVDQPHGLLGQTWKPSKKGRGGQVVAVHDVAEGDVDDYVIASDSIFGTDFLYNKFAKAE